MGDGRESAGSSEVLMGVYRTSVSEQSASEKVYCTTTNNYETRLISNHHKQQHANESQFTPPLPPISHATHTTSSSAFGGLR